MKKPVLAAALGLLALSVSAVALAQTSASDAIKYRQSGYAFMAWNMSNIKAQLDSPEYDQARVVAAANAIAAIANSGMGALFVPGSDEGTGWAPTRLKGEFFNEQDKVREIAVNFGQQANKLQEVAANGDKAAVAAQFGEVGKSCRACHDNFRGPAR